jgi:Ca2+-binding RTX toxin-like protein
MATQTPTSGNDTYQAPRKSTVQTIDGLGGVDTLQFVGDPHYPLISKFSLTVSGTQVTVSVISGASYWLYTLDNFEVVKFRDGTVYLGSSAADSFSGDSGTNFYLVNNSSDTIVEASSGGTDGVYVAISTANDSYTLPTNVENASIISSVALNVQGNASGNTLTGNAYANTLNGLAGADTLVGGAGNDILSGGSDADKMTGGTGSDTFKFSAGDSGQTLTTYDTIADYAKGAVGTGDKIDFTSSLTIGGSALVATSSEAKIDQKTAIATFASGSGTSLTDALSDISARLTASTDTAGEFALFKVSNKGNYFLFISDGVSGVGANDVVVELTGVTTIKGLTLTSGDLTITS